MVDMEVSFYFKLVKTKLIIFSQDTETTGNANMAKRREQESNKQFELDPVIVCDKMRK